MGEDLRELLKTAEEDLKTAKDLYVLGNYRYACFFAQQSVEKFLKAFLLYKEGSYPFTHDITLLIKMCSRYDDDFLYLKEIKADGLDMFYTGVRYPPILDVTEEEAREALKIAEKVRDFIRRKLSL